jgi:hypothetical protein
LHVPEQVAASHHLGADDTKRRAFRESAEHTESTGRRAELDAAGNHRLLGFAAALGVEDVQRDPVLLEDAAALAEFDHRGVPQAALPDCDPQRIVGKRGPKRGPSQAQPTQAKSGQQNAEPTQHQHRRSRVP